ncbi:DUF6236 family protein [Roseateles sp. P5_E4]
MSKLGALYYPYHPEDGAWLRHALLYYDFIGTTVPAVLEEDIDACRLPGHLEILRDQGVYVSGTDSVGMSPVANWLSRLDPAFQFAAVQGAEDFAISTFLDPNFIAEDMKTGQEVKLADFLAEAVASLSSDALVPSTDSGTAFEHLYGTEIPESASAAQSAYIAYQALLPEPAPTMGIPALLAFREKYADERLRLRTAMAKTREKVADAMKDPQGLKMTLAEMATEISSACADLQRALGANRVDSALGLVRELVAIKPSTALVGAAIGVGASSGMSTSFDPSKLTVEQAVVGLGAAAAVAVSSAVVSLVSSRQHKLMQSPYAYLYRARRSGIVG